MQVLLPEIYRWPCPPETFTTAPVKHGIGLVISLMVSLLMVACSIMIWCLSSSAEFSRVSGTPPPAKPKTTTQPKTNPGATTQPWTTPGTTTSPRTIPGTTTPPKPKPGSPPV